MAQRVRIPYRGQSPSSVTQLPILTALHARCPTLFALIIHYRPKKVNPFLENFANFNLSLSFPPKHPLRKSYEISFFPN